MATPSSVPTPSILWSNNNPQTQLQRWWSPPGRSENAFNVEYDTVGGDERKDWDGLDWTAQGGAATVFRVNLSQHGHGPSTIEVAMKRFSPLNNSRERTFMKQKVTEEIEAVKKMHHMHIIEVVGSFENPKHIGFFMLPWAEETLASFVYNIPTAGNNVKLEDGRDYRTVQYLVSTMGCLAHALKYVHEKGMKHKDIKPQNIMIDNGRVLLADFGLSKAVEKGNTTTYGPTGFSKRYAPKEVLDPQSGRTEKQDIFSLGCCFIEIFAVYKGKAPEDALGYDREAEDAAKKYADHVPQVLTWMKENLFTERCDVQLWNLVSRMLADDRHQRPSAAEVWEETVVMSSTRSENIHFCGACCMPVKSDTSPVPIGLPSAVDYTTKSGGPASRNSKLARKDATFSTVYETDEDVPFAWGRNLRITNQAALDAVQQRGHRSWFCRKIVFPKDGSMKEYHRALGAAAAEAEILNRLHTPDDHNHLVSLAGTYRRGRTSVLLIKPVANLDLKTYLSWIEEPHVASYHYADSAKLLRQSFGCLANAVKHIHSIGITHDNIRAQNVLVMTKDSPSVCLAEFGAAANKETPPLATYQASNMSESEYKEQSEYAPPEVQ
ncbi:hypothetical protein AG0111_0g3733 [Alternaria gaisen]|uniref:Uncharacterized protein n=1 Tax=Alternaria gaisen TaxID=167740 RepID=A0ACB6FST2_9PLEO|nr:hypothetical protein AG0111_0g3733 [Alternaria gaisen]